MLATETPTCTGDQGHPPIEAEFVHDPASALESPAVPATLGKIWGDHQQDPAVAQHLVPQSVDVIG